MAASGAVPTAEETDVLRSSHLAAFCVSTIDVTVVCGAIVYGATLATTEALKQYVFRAKACKPLVNVATPAGAKAVAE